MKEEIEKAVEILKKSSFPVVLTGAGVSQESGIPTFRGKDGLWKNFRAEELATPYAFMKNPVLVWEWYEWRRDIIRKASPNPAHLAIKEMEEIFENFLLITQNVDGLHSKAGSKKVVEFHGNIWKERCLRCEFERFFYEKHEKLPPLCPSCGGYLRPGVVWFGEAIPEDALRISYSALSECDVFISAGTSAVVQPAASFVHIVLSRGKPVIEINLDKTPVSELVTVSINGKAGEIFPQILENLKR